MNDTFTVERPNPFGNALAKRETNGAMEIASTRASQEVQAAMVIAKRFPRDQAAAYARVMQACARPALAEVGSYVYPRGDTKVTGPSIRLAEAIAQAWGNIDFGIIELEQKNGESSVMAYAWDLETNTRQTKIFTVKHERHTKRGKYALEDPRDIYEMVANQGARRLRACVLGILPGDVVEAAETACEETLKKGSGKVPLADRLRNMLVKFAELGVTQAMIEKRLQHKMDATDERELLTLGKIFNAIRDGAGKREDYFEFVQAAVRPEGLPDDDGDLGPVQGATPAKPEPVATVSTAEGEQERANPPTGATPPAKTVEPSFEDTMKHLTELRTEGGISEAEVMAYCVRKKMAKDGQQLPELATAKLLTIIKNWDVISAQVRMDREAAKPK